MKFKILCLLLLVLYFGVISCHKEEVPLVIFTTIASQITASDARSGGFISEGDATSYGVCWNLSGTPTVEDSLTMDGSGSGKFTSRLTGLRPKCLYYVRAYAINSTGISYGDEVTFTTLGDLPAALTTPPSIIERTSAVLTGIVTSNLVATSVKFEYGPDTNYGYEVTASPAIVAGSADPANVTASISYLQELSTYHFRIVAENECGKVYGNDIMFKLSGITGFVTDVEGNVYKTIVIGTQTWMTENLKTEHLNDGSAIPNVTDEMEWSELATPGYRYYDDNIDNKEIYGALYNWHTVNTGKLCPSGWHVPSFDEWHIIEAALKNSVGGAMKETGLEFWMDPNMGATNSSGFSARPGGFKWYTAGFDRLGRSAYFWSSTFTSGYPLQSYMFILEYTDDRLHQFANWNGFGLSIRCIQDPEK